MYGLSFSEEFFSGDGSCDIHEIAPSDRPTSVLQAIISLPRETQLEIAGEMSDFGASNPEFYVDSESFAFDLLERARQVDLCDNLDSPVRVYLDAGQNHWVEVY